MRGGRSSSPWATLATKSSAGDLDATHRPWLTDEDEGVWIARGGKPHDGRHPSSHAVVLEGDGSWG
jgi:hypothetical protein